MLIETVMFWGMAAIENILNMAFAPIEWGTQHIHYMVAVADVWGYLDSFINLWAVSALVISILAYDQLDFILRFAVGLWEKLPFN